MQHAIYYLPGRGGKLETGLGSNLLARGLQISGRELLGEFTRLPFEEQVLTVADDLRKHFWTPKARVICNSFGAYLFLHAQSILEPFCGKVLLLSPILGAALNESTGMTFVPPRAERLMELASSKTFPTPIRCEFHVGESDWQSDPEAVAKFCGPQKIHFRIVPNAGHQLPKAYVNEQLDRWLED